MATGFRFAQIMGLTLFYPPFGMLRALRVLTTEAPRHIRYDVQ